MSLPETIHFILLVNMTFYIHLFTKFDRTPYGKSALSFLWLMYLIFDRYTCLLVLNNIGFI